MRGTMAFRVWYIRILARGLRGVLRWLVNVEGAKLK